MTAKILTFDFEEAKVATSEGKLLQWENSLTLVSKSLLKLKLRVRGECAL